MESRHQIKKRSIHKAEPPALQQPWPELCRALGGSFPFGCRGCCEGEEMQSDHGGSQRGNLTLKSLQCRLNLVTLVGWTDHCVLGLCLLR